MGSEYLSETFIFILTYEALKMDNIVFMVFYDFHCKASYIVENL